MGTTELERRIAAIASLDAPVRRGLYLYVTAQRRAVGRDEAARALGIARPLAAFHLDKLVEQGLLETSYRRLTGRRGPGAGRPAKLYHRSGGELSVSVPSRRYELAGRIFARVLSAAPPRVRRALSQAARAVGRSIASRGLTRRRHAVERPRSGLARVSAVLAACGYEPARRAGEVRLRNCPFAALADEHRAIVCSTNLALVRGMLHGLGVRTVRAEIDREPGSCCVVLRSTARRRR